MKELNYFTIEGAWGGNQDWFTDEWMNKGGCGAATACDSCIYLDRQMGRKKLYPFDRSQLTKEDYICFSNIMKPYLRPRARGINTTALYQEGFAQYLKDCGETALKMDDFSGERSCSEAEQAVIGQIEKDFPVPCLILRHQDPGLEDYVWHWFLLTGYREKEGELQVKTATYGEAQWLALKRLWDTGYEEKGGLVLYRWS